MKFHYLVILASFNSELIAVIGFHHRTANLSPISDTRITKCFHSLSVRSIFAVTLTTTLFNHSFFHVSSPLRYLSSYLLSENKLRSCRHRTKDYITNDSLFNKTVHDKRLVSHGSIYIFLRSAFLIVPLKIPFDFVACKRLLESFEKNYRCK